jgi:multidrug efflux pump subunit AcrA (membrane-fusion protein)
MGKHSMVRFLAPVLGAVTLCAAAVLAGACGGGDSRANAADGKAGDEADAKDAKDKDGKGKEAERQAAPVEVATLRRGPMEAVLRYSADLDAEQSVQVHSQSPQLRRVVQLLVEEGQQVGRGQLLAKLQDDEQRQDVARVSGQLAKARADLKRQERLFEQKLISEQAFTEAKHQLEQLEIELAGRCSTSSTSTAWWCGSSCPSGSSPGCGPGSRCASSPRPCRGRPSPAPWTGWRRWSTPAAAPSR